MIKSFINQKLPTIGITVGYMAMLLILSAIPDTSSPENPFMLLSPTIQNLAHIPAYGLLALLWMFNLRNLGASRLQVVVAAIILASTYGVLMELLQTAIPGRFPSILDCFLNVAGILICTACYLRVGSQSSIICSRPVSARIRS